MTLRDNDLRDRREVLEVHYEFRAEIRGALHVDPPRVRPGRFPRHCRPATVGPAHSQFADTIEEGPQAGPRPEGLLPTLP